MHPLILKNDFNKILQRGNIQFKNTKLEFKPDAFDVVMVTSFLESLANNLFNKLQSGRVDFTFYFTPAHPPSAEEWNIMAVRLKNSETESKREGEEKLSMEIVQWIDSTRESLSSVKIVQSRHVLEKGNSIETPSGQTDDLNTTTPPLYATPFCLAFLSPQEDYHDAH